MNRQGQIGIFGGRGLFGLRVGIQRKIGWILFIGGGYLMLTAPYFKVTAFIIFLAGLLLLLLEK